MNIQKLINEGRAEGRVAERLWLDQKNMFVTHLNKKGYKVIKATEKEDFLGCDFWVVDMYNGKKRIPIDLTTSMDRKMFNNTVFEWNGMTTKIDNRIEWLNTGKIPVMEVKSNPTPAELRAAADSLVKWIKTTV